MVSNSLKKKLIQENANNNNHTIKKQNLNFVSLSLLQTNMHSSGYFIIILAAEPEKKLFFVEVFARI